ncbi:hypothetical protein C2S52_005135 [Perilla frutescens var. hirtella]|nr:hypothetical protein C2S52_005135 [Perilla frutescens var. hirtella]
MDAQRTTIAHPALSMINIKSFVPIILEQESAQFSSWAELFKIHAWAFQVLHHILPSSSLPDEELSTDITMDKIKKTDDLLANVGAKVSNERLGLCLIGGLTNAYRGVISMIEHQDPLPDFSKARSMILLEETGISDRVAAEGGAAALMAAASDRQKPLPHGDGSAFNTTSRPWNNRNNRTRNFNRDNGGSNNIPTYGINAGGYSGGGRLPYSLSGGGRGRGNDARYFLSTMVSIFIKLMSCLQVYKHMIVDMMIRGRSTGKMN